MTPEDLFASHQEARAERVAIMVEAGVDDPVRRMDDDRHACEVRDVVRRFYPDPKAAAEYMNLCEKHRGKAAADRLRADVRKAFFARRDEGRRAA